MRLDNWFNHWAFISNEAYPDQWVDELKEIWYSRIPASQNTKKDKCQKK